MEKILYDDINVDLDDFYIDESEFEEELTTEDKYRIVMDNLDFKAEELMSAMDYDVEEEIIAIGDLRLWNGGVTGYKKVGYNLKDCLYTDCDYNKFYIDARGNFRSVGVHHDGTNYVLYRMFKEDLSTEQKENFLEKIYGGKCTAKDITRYTRRLGDVIEEACEKYYGYKL